MLLAVGTTDILFALDSIPVIFGISREAFIVLAANAFVLLGLRALFFLVPGLLDKLVRWFSPTKYDAARDVEELYARSDVTMHDLVEDPGELQNIGDPTHPRHNPELVARMLAKLNTLIERELVTDERPFDLGTRDVTYRDDDAG